MTTDLFGQGQASLFGDAPDRIPHPNAPAYGPDPERVRRKLTKLLDTARAADRLPWTEREARMWRTVFPNMAKWLPEEERDRLRLEFTRELERLNLAA